MLPGFSRPYLVQMKKTRPSLLALLLFIPVFLFITEFIIYFPFTYRTLDREGRTKLVKGPDELAVTITGDIMLGDRADSFLREKGWGHPFAATRHILQTSDLAIGNLEGPLTRRGRRDTSRTWAYRVDPDSVRGLTAAGFHAMALANNHMRDCGNEGVVDSVLHLSNAGIAAFGGGATADEAHRPLLRTIRGVRIALFSYLAPHVYLGGGKHFYSYSQFAAGPGRAGGALGTLAAVGRDIARIRKDVDVVIVIFHSGDRYEKRPKPDMVRHLRTVLDLGADAVVCHGTHIAGPVEVWRGKPLLHGVGNYAFGSQNINANFSLLATLFIDIKEKRIRRVEALPIYANNANFLIRYQAKVLEANKAQGVLRGLISFLPSDGHAPEIKGNKLVLRL